MHKPTRQGAFYMFFLSFFSTSLQRNWESVLYLCREPVENFFHYMVHLERKKSLPTRLNERTDTPWRTYEFILASFGVRLDAQRSSPRRMKRLFKKVSYIHESLLLNPFTLFTIPIIVIQSEAKDLGNTKQWEPKRMFPRSFLPPVVWMAQWRLNAKTPFPSECEQGEGSVSQSICIRIYMRVLILRYSLTSPSKAHQKNCWRTCLQISELAKSLQKVWKKWMQTFGRYVVKQ